MENKIFFSNILSLRDIKNEDLLRILLFGYCSQLILSKEIFKNNKEIVEFVSILELEFREYVYASRTVVVSRLIREIEKKEYSQLVSLRDKMINFLSLKLEIPIEPDIHQLTKNEQNYVKSMVNKYRRGK